MKINWNATAFATTIIWFKRNFCHFKPNVVRFGCWEFLFSIFFFFNFKAAFYEFLYHLEARALYR